jgi:hypothetical protein
LPSNAAMRSGDIPSLSDWLGFAPLSVHHHIIYRVYKKQLLFLQVGIVLQKSRKFNMVLTGTKL